jgi:hypothetical protein
MKTSAGRSKGSAGRLPPEEIIVATFGNDIHDIEDRFVFVLEDFHAVQDGVIDMNPTSFHLAGRPHQSIGVDRAHAAPACAGNEPVEE